MINLLNSGNLISWRGCTAWSNRNSRNSFHARIQKLWWQNWLLLEKRWLLQRPWAQASRASKRLQGWKRGSRSAWKSPNKSLQFGKSLTKKSFAVNNIKVLWYRDTVCSIISFKILIDFRPINWSKSISCQRLLSLEVQAWELSIV